MREEASPHEPNLRVRALRALARREYSHAELARKLGPHAQSAQQLAELLVALEAKGLLSDARAADSVVRQKSARWGAARIRAALQAKGLERGLIDSVLEPLDATEWQRALSVWQDKFGTDATHCAPIGWQARQKLHAKQARFMMARGFSPDTVRKLLKQGDQDDQAAD